ncbi:hypothetical protein AJ88_28670 [Mesorhizobium amorphae CCBAU 01583]|nr:hypothetical protein AJ88_28670 [Mesorhizobium amorphae CCBAU 01583]
MPRGREGEARYVEEIEVTRRLGRFVRKLEKKHPRLLTGYGHYRQILALGHRCDIVASSLIAKRPAGFQPEKQGTKILTIAMTATVETNPRAI